MPTFKTSELTPDNGQISLDLPADTSVAPTLAGPADTEKLIRYHAAAQGVDPNLAVSVAKRESGLNPATREGPKIEGTSERAFGPMQLMPQTAKMLGIDLTNPAENVKGGVRYLKQLLDKHNGDVKAALTEYGGFKTKDPSEYINSILGQQGSSIGGRRFQPGQLSFGEPPPSPVNISETVAGNLPFIPEQVKTIGKAIGEGATSPWATSALAGIIGGPFAAIAAAPATRAIKGAFQGEAPEDIAKGAANVAANEVIGQGAGAALGLVAPKLAKFVYGKTFGIDPEDTRAVRAVNDMVDRGISGGMGGKATQRALKADVNEGFNEIFDKWGNKQAGPAQPGLVRTGVAGQASAQQGASYGAPVTVNQRDIANKLVSFLRSEPTMSQPDRNAIIKAYQDFVGSHPNQDISLNDARKIMQNLSKKVSWNDPDAVGKMFGQKAVHHFLGEAVQEAIPDATDAAKFAYYRTELAKLIDIEDLPIFHKSGRLLGMETSVPLAGGMIGGASGYYSHFSPLAAAGRGLLGRLMLSAPNNIVHMLNSPTARQLGIGAFNNILTDTSPHHKLTLEEIEKLRIQLGAEQ